jgi:hypothetical protein
LTHRLLSALLLDASRHGLEPVVPVR